MAVNGRVRGNKKSIIFMMQNVKMAPGSIPEVLKMMPIREALEDSRNEGMPRRKRENSAKKTDFQVNPTWGKGPLETSLWVHRAPHVIC